MDRDRFEKLALEHLDAVYRMAVHLTRDPGEAEDLVQEVYARAFRPGTVERFEDHSEDGESGGMRSWLFAITHNVFYTRLKRDKRRPATVDGFYSEEGTERAPDEPPPVFDRSGLDWEHVDSRLKGAIDDLRDEYREVLMMWGVDGLKYREIAAILDVPIGTVMSRLHRARKILADKLLEDADAAGEMGVTGLARRIEEKERLT